MEMDYLRWILLGAAIVIVFAVYFFGRSRKKDQNYSPLDAANDMPSFAAKEAAGDDEWMHGVGPVRVVEDSDYQVEENLNEVEPGATDESDLQTGGQETSDPDPIPEIESQTVPEAVSENMGEQAVETKEKDVAIDDVISVYVLAQPDEAIKGEKILSASYALKLDFGDMKIFHRHSQTPNREIEFSMANIQQPGWFEIDKMHEMETTGVSFFMQVNLVEKPSAVLDEMLICAHNLSTMLGATLCNAQRKPLDEPYTIELRKKVKYLETIKAQSV